MVPVNIDVGSASLAAILLDDGYYNLILEQHDEGKNLPFANPAALILLKARAWLDLSARAKKGQEVDDKDIAKHRSERLPDREHASGRSRTELGNVDSRRSEVVRCCFSGRKRRMGWNSKFAQDDIWRR